MAQINKCDRCDREIQEKQPRRLKAQGAETIEFGEICNSCINELRLWWAKGKQTELFEKIIHRWENDLAPIIRTLFSNPEGKSDAEKR